MKWMYLTGFSAGEHGSEAVIYDEYPSHLGMRASRDVEEIYSKDDVDKLKAEIEKLKDDLSSWELGSRGFP